VLYKSGITTLIVVQKDGEFLSKSVLVPVQKVREEALIERDPENMEMENNIYQLASSVGYIRSALPLRSLANVAS
jgi:hypothetical protein